MSIPGRNDPCPCGSGRKYKKCCLQKDIESQGGPIPDFTYESYLALRHRTTEKLDDILDEVLAERGYEEFDSFEEEYWDPPFLEDEELDQLLGHEEAEASLELQMDMAMRNGLLIDGLFPAAYALKNHSERFTVPERRFLRDFEEARLAYVQLREFFPEEGRMIAEDIFDGSLFTIYDKGVSIQGKPHDIVSCRLVRFPGREGYVFEALASSILPPPTKDFLVRNLDGLAMVDSPGIPDSKAVPAYLKANPLVFYWVEMWIGFLNISRKRPALVTTDGEELVFIEARFSAKDPQALLSALKAQRNFTHEVKDGIDTFHWLSRKEMIMGTLRVEMAPGVLCLETNSRERFRKWEKKLKSLGEIGFLEKREESQEAALARLPEPGSRAEAPGLSEAELKALAPQLEEHFLSRWLKEKIPALGNRTPVQAAKDPEGRRQLVELLDYMENQSSRAGPGNMVATFDVDRVRERLGLTA